MKKLKNILSYSAIIVLFVSNILNYFFAHLYLNDRLLQWKIAMFSISYIIFCLFAYLTITILEKRRSKRSIRVISVWATFYTFANLIGVILGYNLHTKGFMMILFSITILGTVNLFVRYDSYLTFFFLGAKDIIRRIWQKLQ